MKKLLLPMLLAALLAAAWALPRLVRENRRLTANLRALSEDVDRYRTQWGAEAASARVLRLRCREFERLRAEDAAAIRRLGIRLRRLEAASKSVARTEAAFRTPVRDTVIVRRRDTVLLRDTVRLFRWRDAWVEVEGAVWPDSAHCRVLSVDTLRQIVHRVPRRFLFIRWGTKAIRQEVVSSNPHTRIVYTEQIRFER